MDYSLYFLHDTGAYLTDIVTGGISFANLSHPHHAGIKNIVSVKMPEHGGPMVTDLSIICDQE